DLVDDGDRLAVARQEDEQAARRHAVDPEYLRRHGVDATKVVQQPAVGAEVGEGVPQRRKIELLEWLHWCLGSLAAARHSQRPAPVERQAVCNIAPSKPTSSRSSSANAAV